MSETIHRQQPAIELIERASAFFASSGWGFEPCLDSEYLFTVLGPEKEIYIVVIHPDPQFTLCTCPSFAEERECIHLLALEYELHSLSGIKAQEQLLDVAEHCSNGTDLDYWIDRKFGCQ